MKFEEENYARDLHRELKAKGPRGAKLHLHGSGNQWTCAATRGNRTCSTACLHHPGETPGPEYLIAFQQYNMATAVGRTFTTEEAVSATTCWLDGHPIEILYKRFAFVDGQQRALTEMEKALLTLCPELGKATTHELRRIVSDRYYLSFVSGERSCRIAYSGRNPQPDAIFHGDGTELFRFPVGSNDDLTAVLKSWFCEGALPSRLRETCPWVGMHPMAEYFEARYSTEAEFMTSWDGIESFYRNGRNFPFAPQVLALIAEMRRAGYDRKLRAGQTLWSLMLSRSRRHGLRENQPYLLFSFLEGAVMEVTVLGRGKITLPEIKFTPEVDALLQELAAKEVD